MKIADIDMVYLFECYLSLTSNQQVTKYYCYKQKATSFVCPYDGFSHILTQTIS